jgi:MurNAc alpha-1-phosphate uridylyltransferase
MSARAAMILAAGRGERMRPLSDLTPKPLLEVGGVPLIERQVRALVAAGYVDIVVNVSHLADRLVAALGDGSALGASIRWSREAEPLETAGGIATAMPLLPEGPALIVSGDLWTAFDYRSLERVARTMADDPAPPRVHLVMVDNPDYHPRGDFVLVPGPGGRGRLTADDGPRLTYGNIGVYDTALFRELPRGRKLKLLPLLEDWIARGWVSGEHYAGAWANLGTPADLADLNRRLTAGMHKDTR